MCVHSNNNSNTHAHNYINIKFLSSNNVDNYNSYPVDFVAIEAGISVRTIEFYLTKDKHKPV